MLNAYIKCPRHNVQDGVEAFRKPCTFYTDYNLEYTSNHDYNLVLENSLYATEQFSQDCQAQPGVYMI